MDFSICILSYNHPQLTARAIRSCQRFSDDRNIFLLHNGSLVENQKLLQNEFPQIQHWVLPENRGYTGGANEILKRSLTLKPWTFVLTNDCELQTPVSLPDLPGLYGPTIWRRHAGRIDSKLGKLSFRNGQLSHIKSETELHQIKIDERLYVPGTAFLIHKSVYDSVGFFDEQLGTYWEDVDFSLRAHSQGFIIGHQSKIEVLHFVGKTCHKDPVYTTYLFQRNRRRICLKHCPDKFKLQLKFNFWRETVQKELGFLLKRSPTDDHRRTLYKKALKDV